MVDVPHARVLARIPKGARVAAPAALVNVILIEDAVKIGTRSFWLRLKYFAPLALKVPNRKHVNESYTLTSTVKRLISEYMSSETYISTHPSRSSEYANVGTNNLSQLHRCVGSKPNDFIVRGAVCLISSEDTFIAPDIESRETPTRTCGLNVHDLLRKVTQYIHQ